MTILSTIIYAVAGWFMNRIRGGLYEKRLEVEVNNKVIGLNKLLNDIVFGILAVFTFSTTYHGFIDDAPNYTIESNWWWVFLLFTGCMMAGRAPGWGGYIGGMVHKVANRPEIKIIDKIVSVFEFSWLARNTIALSLRGLWWGACLAIATAVVGEFSKWVIFTSLLMGPIYLGTITYAEETKGERGLGWPYGEYVFGAVLWASLVVV